MSAEKQIGLAVFAFFAGWFVGQTVSLQGLPTANWPAWVSAGATVLLAVAAYRAFGEWRRQFFARRDHDLALRLVAAVDESYRLLDEFRTPTRLLSDPPEPYSPDEPFAQYYAEAAKYRARWENLVAATEARLVATNEALTVWDQDYQLGELITRLQDMEIEVRKEAGLFVQCFGPQGTPEGYKPNRELLHSPADINAKDPFAERYESILHEVREHLRPKLRMEGGE